MKGSDRCDQAADDHDVPKLLDQVDKPDLTMLAYAGCVAGPICLGWYAQTNMVKRRDVPRIFQGTSNATQIFVELASFFMLSPSSVHSI